MSGSSPDVGSSRISSSTLDASAATSATFCRFALRVRARLLGRVQLEPLEQLRAAALVQPAAEAAEQIDRLAAGQVGPEVDVSGHVREPAVERDGIAQRIAAQEPRLARIGAQQAEQNPDRGRLPGAVRAEEPVHLAGLHGQVQPIQRPGRAKGLDQPGDGDRGFHNG
jgi:hypothetical protein